MTTAAVAFLPPGVLSFPVQLKRRGPAKKVIVIGAASLLFRGPSVLTSTKEILDWARAYG
jgi:hypothetical protein